MIDSVAGAPTRPSPAAISTMAGTRTPQYEESASVSEAIQNPTPISARPEATTTLVPMRRAKPSAERGGHHRRGCEGERVHAGCEGVVAPHELEVLGDEEDEPEQGEEADRDGGAGGGEAGVGEDAHVEQRLGDPTLPGHEGAEQDDGGDEPAMVSGSVQPRCGASMTV